MLLAPECRTLRPVEGRDDRATEVNLALVRNVQAREQREQRRLPRSGRSDDDTELAGAERGVEPVERNLSAVAPGDAARGEQLSTHAFEPCPYRYR